VAAILIADDDPSALRFLTVFSTRLGHEAVPVDDGAQALAQLRRRSDFDLLITDYGMPGMDGLELTAAVRSDPRLAGLPILMLSGNLYGADVGEVLEAGVTALMAKPLELAALRAMVADLLGHPVPCDREARTATA